MKKQANLDGKVVILSTINCSSVVDEEDFYERCKAAAIIGTLQAGFTDLEYLGVKSLTLSLKEKLY